MVRSSLKGSQCQGLRRGAWTEEEDSRLRKCIDKYGTGKWRLVPKMAGLNRCRKSCRLRWINYLSPGIKRGRFDEDEDELIIRLHKLLGNRWSLIAGRIPGRTANDIKNYWNSHLGKKMEAEHKNVVATDAEIRKPHAQMIPIEWGRLKEPISDETKYEEAKFDISILPAALDNFTASADSIIIHEGSNSEILQVGFNMSKLDANPNFEGIQGLGDDFLREIGGWEEFLLDLDVWGDLGIF